MTVDVVIEADGWDALDLQTLAARAEAATLSHLGLDPAMFETVVLGCDDARIAALNADFRGKPQPTNVLSWPGEERGAELDGGTPALPDPLTEAELGDIALALETCERQAAEAEKPVGDHVMHLLVHGMLHLLGYDHVRDKDATLMETTEVAILGKLGVDDPY